MRQGAASAAIDPARKRISAEEAALLLIECLDYLEASGLSRSTFSFRVSSRSGLVSEMLAGTRPTRRIADAVRSWIAAHPPRAGRIKPRRMTAAGQMYEVDAARAANVIAARDALDAEAAQLDARRVEVEQARARHVADCARRERERSTRGPRGGSLGGAVQETMIESAGDAIWAVRRRWPDLWARIVETARERGSLPGAVMVEAIEKGLAA